ncbi:MAG: hypothetical protein MUC92_05275 [Fimbriimonadaceae bacterium]|nr:hypothetical protein [Fimbriimonadaceae bacterium]
MSLIAPLFLAALANPALANVSLRAGVTTYAPNSPFTVAVHVKLQPGWHTYWMNPGDSGMPSRVNWTLPKGWKASELRFPTPEQFSANDFMTYGYHDEAVFLATITPGAEAPATAQIRADVRILVCDESCIPFNGSATINVRKGSEAAENSSNAKFIQEWEQRVPQPLKTPGTIAFAKEALTWTLPAATAPKAKSFFFFGADPGVLNNSKPVERVIEENGFIVLTLNPSDVLYEKPTQLRGILVPRGENGKALGPGYWVSAPVK